jgi:hypothetical protein
MVDSVDMSGHPSTMPDTSPDEPDSTRDDAFARFLRKLSDAATELADALEGRKRPGAIPSLDDVYLGSAQRSMAELPGMRSEEGMSPREVCRLIGNDDEPNVRSSLKGMVNRGVMELVPGVAPQRFRLIGRYRSE